MGHRHRAILKQQNKAFKGSSSKPKSLKEKRKAAAANASALSINRPTTKLDRVQRSKQRRLQLRRDQQQQQLSNPCGPPPKVVLLLPFSDSVCVESVFNELRRELIGDDGAVVDGGVLCGDMDEDGTAMRTDDVKTCSSQSRPHHSRYLFTLPAYARNPAIPKRHHQKVLLVPAPRISEEETGDQMQQEGVQIQRRSELLRYMDLCSCCDVLVCLFGGNCTYEKSAFSSRGYKVLQALKLQGLPPSVIGIGCIDPSLLDPAGLPQEKYSASESLKFMRRFFESELGAERKFFGIANSADWRNALRALGAAAPLIQADPNAKVLAKGAEAAACRRRGHLLALSWRIAWHSLSEDPAAQLEPCLEAWGLIRGAGLTCRLPVHITGVGDFVLARIEPLGPTEKRREFAASSAHATTEVEALGAEMQVLKSACLSHRSTEVIQASQPLQPLDAAALEQTWPTEDEIPGNGNTAPAVHRRCVRVPKDVGEYERAWLESDTDGADDDGEEEVNMDSDADMQPGEVVSADNEQASSANDEADEDWKPLISSEQHDMKTDNEAYAARRREAAEMEKEFPDQVDTPLDIPAKERFQKYRGLKSFRSSPWAQNEDLPLGYGRIIDVSSMKKVVQKHPSLSGKEFGEALVEAMAQRVASRFAVQAQSPAPAPTASADDDLMVPDFLVVSQLLQHETQVAVVHSQVTFCDDAPVKGKDPLLMSCGFRRFPASPIYSEEPRQGMHSTSKWKLKRWAEPGTTLTATVYSPLVLPPSPCILLRYDQSGNASDGGQLYVDATRECMPLAFPPE
ncbi:hypothetical protein, conserved [Eimeria maxima]|uniref:Ribosome biogenesis protein BMS1/TSR1 C-terminal domain-containing protein n=1 Tax=Eimeria maxima TaxID=5804 RepID=U6M976_EIMMA|nr:hypothetical protein, conserved [Eimeria maxima]CDJ60782.1 hypothetical protein, conserved [Eimeria maxima]